MALDGIDPGIDDLFVGAELKTEDDLAIDSGMLLQGVAHRVRTALALQPIAMAGDIIQSGIADHRGPDIFVRMIS